MNGMHSRNGQFRRSSQRMRTARSRSWCLIVGIICSLVILPARVFAQSDMRADFLKDGWPTFSLFWFWLGTFGMWVPYSRAVFARVGENDVNHSRL
jgi:hypothetical protein